MNELLSLSVPFMGGLTRWSASPLQKRQLHVNTAPSSTLHPSLPSSYSHTHTTHTYTPFSLHPATWLGKRWLHKTMGWYSAIFLWAISPPLRPKLRPWYLHMSTAIFHSEVVYQFSYCCGFQNFTSLWSRTVFIFKFRYFHVNKSKWSINGSLVGLFFLFGMGSVLMQPCKNMSQLWTLEILMCSWFSRETDQSHMNLFVSSIVFVELRRLK